MESLYELKKKIKRDRYLFVLLSMGLLYFIIFKYLPYINLTIAFQEYDLVYGILKSPWVGFKHFKDFMNSIYFVRLLRNTILLNVYGLIFGFPIPIIFALLLNELKKIRFKKVIQTVSYLPHFVSHAIVVGMVLSFLSPSTGIVNKILVDVFRIEPIYFMADPKYFRPVFVTMQIWKSFGWSSIIYLAALTNIDPQLYEAAIVDGAGRWKQLWHITLPGIKNVIIILLILRMGNMLDIGFEAVLLMYNPLIYDTADVLSTFIYRRGIAGEHGIPDFSYATAVGLFKSVINLMLVLAANYLSKKYTEKSLF